MDELTISTSTAIRNNSIIFEQNTDTAGIRRDTYMIDMNRTALYYIAAALWGTPGVIITIKGVEAYLTMPGRKLWWLMLITAAVLAGFFFMFRKAADKYSAHIAAQARKTAPWRAFPLSGWILIVFMLCLGISYPGFRLSSSRLSTQASAPCCSSPPAASSPTAGKPMKKAGAENPVRRPCRYKKLF